MTVQLNPPTDLYFDEIDVRRVGAVPSYSGAPTVLSTNAFQKAVDNHRVVKIPRGAFLCEPITINYDEVTIIGANQGGLFKRGAGVSALYLAPGSNAPLISGKQLAGNLVTQTISLEKFKVYGQKALQTVAAPLINMPDSLGSVESQWRIDDLFITDSKGDGLYIGALNRGTNVKGTVIYGNDGNGLNCLGSDNNFLSNAIGANPTGYGMYFHDGGWNNEVVALNVWGCQAGLVALGANQIRILGGCFDSNLKQGVYAQSCIGVAIMGSTFIGNSNAGPGPGSGVDSNIHFKSMGAEPIVSAMFQPPASGRLLPVYDVFMDGGGTFIDAGCTRNSSASGFSNGAVTRVRGNMVMAAGGLTTAYVEKSANYTLTIADSKVRAITNSGITLTLPSASSAGTGREFRIRNDTGGNITVAGTINGVTNDTLPTATARTYVSNSAAYYTF